MLINVANPVYDAVFKYLVEDLRIAKILISALLKKEVVEINLRRNEYASQVRDDISMMRIDFGAQVREADGTTRLVLIEVQKTWIETETLRFRQYLGTQYFNPENMVTADRVAEEMGPYALPMVTVYLLGHRVGHIEEPVLYVNHHPYDYNGNPVTKGMPDPFVESLVHDSIIVQIPLLRGQVNNRLEKILSVFDQTRKNKHDGHLLNIQEEDYDGDEEMNYILHRLTLAAASYEMRRKMMVEDEFLSVLESRDTAIMKRNKIIEDQQERLSQQQEQLSQQQEQLSQQQERLSQQQERLSQQQEQLEHQNQLIKTVVQTMAGKGLSAAEIARQTGICESAIRQLMP